MTMSNPNEARVNEATVARIAALSRIKVPVSERGQFATQLSGTLSWFEQLSAVDTTGVPAMTSVVEALPSMRADAVTDGDVAVDLLRNAPASEHGFFTVPKVVE
jgi:aspartyl-tRNA(Asn)/glutamyl-tRNA(Gln) amidotransferase subunit C